MEGGLIMVGGPWGTVTADAARLYRHLHNGAPIEVELARDVSLCAGLLSNAQREVAALRERVAAMSKAYAALEARGKA